jgi:gluconolactonase
VEDGLEVVAESYMGKRLNSPNDAIVASDGAIIFTDPHYGLLEGLGGPAEQEQAHKGVYHVAPRSSDISLLVGDFEAPNGLALSLDEKKLYVDDSIQSHIRVFDVNDDWTLSNGKVFAVLERDGDGDPDGRIVMPEVAANINWGDDGHSLYIAASTSIYRLKLKTRGR